MNLENNDLSPKHTYNYSIYISNVYHHNISPIKLCVFYEDEKHCCPINI